ncbi:MAG TPA: hypothetical protein VGD50_07310 [Candidatus Baltobacteraceae bacterium]
MNETLTPIDEQVRIPAPCPAPVGIAFDGTQLWVTSWEAKRLYAFDAKTGAVSEESAVPGTPVGVTVIGEELRVVVGDAQTDDRSIRRYIVGHGFKNGAIPCPEETGSHLAYDGEFLFLSQRHHQRILELDAEGVLRRTIALPRQITGMVIVDGYFYVATTESRESEDYRLLRVDARKDPHVMIELAEIPFQARGLAFDGSRFWTNDRFKNTIVAFARPDA